MDAIETVIFWLAVFWTPSLLLVGFLLLPKRLIKSTGARSTQ